MIVPVNDRELALLLLASILIAKEKNAARRQIGSSAKVSQNRTLATQTTGSKGEPCKRPRT